MSSTDVDRARRLAGELFDEIVTPLATTRRLAGKPAYFPLAADTKLTSYYQRPVARLLRPSEFEFPGGGTAEGLVEALAALWTAAGDSDLAAMAAKLKEIAAALEDEAAEGDGSVSILCYTMF
jgi:hypothetical protein